MQAIYYAAASLDGYIATPEGGVDWLAPFEACGEDFGYAAFYASVDALILGRRTFDKTLALGPWPYGGKPCWVCTRRAVDAAPPGVSFTDAALRAALAQVAGAGCRPAWLVGGGALASSFRSEGLISEYVVSVIPVILGAGIPLLAPAGAGPAARTGAGHPLPRRSGTAALPAGLRDRGLAAAAPGGEQSPAMKPARIVLKPARQKSLLRRHPWVFSGAVAKVEGDPPPGATVALRSSDGAFLGWAAYSPRSQIVARVWSWDEAETVGPDFLRRRIDAALALRAGLRPAPASDALRLVNAESDGMPGLVADRYADVLVLQLLSAGAEAWREELCEALLSATGARAVYERSDGEVRELEGLERRTGWLRGGGETTVPIAEHGLAWQVDIAHGHKTGHYLDQRENRARVAQLAAGRQVLNCFCYTGGFSLNALAGGAARVTSVESAAPALALAQRNLAANGLPAERAEWIEGDVFHELRRFRDQGRRFGLVVLDPPKFAPTAAFAERAARGYKDINLLAFKLLEPGGVLASFSCSGGVPAELFRKIVAGAALDAGVDARLVEQLHAAPDHPVGLAFPEGEYLKGLVVVVAG